MFPKKLLVSSTVAATMALLAGCSSGEGGSSASANSDPNAGPQTIKISTVQNDRVAMQGVIVAFQKLHPKVKITFSSADTDPYQTTLRTQMSSHTGPDIFYAWSGAGNPAAGETLAKAGYLKDLSSEPWVAKIPASLKQLTQYKGNTYLRPMSVGGIGAVFNMGALEGAGLKVPTTWTQVIQLCTDAKAKGKVAFALGAATPWNAQLIDYALVPTLVYRSDPTFAQKMQAGKVTFAGSTGWKEALGKNVEMQTAGCFQPNPLGTTYQSAMDMVAKGSALASVQTQSGIGQLTLRNPSGNFVQEPFPATNDPSETWMANSPGSEYAINSAAKNPALIQEFLDFMGTDAIANAYAATVHSIPLIPTGKSVIPKAVEALAKYTNDSKTTPYMDVYWPNARVQQTHFSVVQDVLGGKMSVEDAMKQMDEAYTQGS